VLDGNEARKKAIYIEKLIREADVEMEYKYKNTAVIIINRLKESNKLIKESELHNLILSLL